MFFDMVALLVLTFFCALGMTDFSDRLIKRCFSKRFRYSVFVVAKVHSRTEEETENALRSLIIETENANRRIILDCSDCDRSQTLLCHDLSRRFNITVAENKKECEHILLFGLHEGEKTV